MRKHVKELIAVLKINVVKKLTHTHTQEFQYFG